MAGARTVMSEKAKGTRRLSPDTWARVEALFHESSTIPERDLAAFLDRECGEDEAVRTEVVSLIASAGSDLARHLKVVGRVSDQLMDSTESAGIGRQIGRYRIARLLGRGGSGIVFLGVAEQSGLEQHVAIKVLPTALLSEETRTRFNNECGILASLAHPNIASFLEAGATPEGVPYVIMEYVDGTPVDSYCANQRLDIVGRVSIFLSICAAVQYAHERRIIHRDIKPGNILVVDGGMPKLLDFGIAKLVGLEQKLTGSTTVTRMMTPQYASPEQLRGDRIGTPSDIYSLGVLLYRLLTGSLPFGNDVRTPDELERLIATSTPQPPSAASSNNSLRGTVDSIVLTALHRDPERRYESVSLFGGDLRDYLTGQPISKRISPGKDH